VKLPFLKRFVKIAESLSIFFEKNLMRNLRGMLFFLPLRSEFDTIMKADIHPDYHEVVFADSSSEFKFLTRSTMTSTETIVWEDGKTYPMVRMEVSSASHPFYTGKKQSFAAAGRVEKFNKKYKR
jgi:large subunit ribosomal protein L31